MSLSREYGLIHIFAQWILRILRNVYFSHVTRYCIYFGISFRKLLLTMYLLRFYRDHFMRHHFMRLSIYEALRNLKKWQRPTVCKMLVKSPSRACSSHSSSWKIFGSARDLFPFSSRSKIGRNKLKFWLWFTFLFS